jgi:hypothetical protein
MKLNDLWSDKDRELPRQIAKQLVKQFRSSGQSIPTFKEFMREPITELKSPDEVEVLKQHLQHMFQHIGFKVEFTDHFIERLMGREHRITVQEITAAFSKLKAKYGRQLLAAKGTHLEGIIKDFARDLNIVFAIDGAALDAITIMKKDPRHFTPNSVGNVEFKV